MPDPLDLNAVKQRFEQQDTKELTEIISYNQDDYRPEVIVIIKAILSDRGFDKESIAKIDASYHDLIAKTSPEIKGQQRIAKIPKFLLWLMYLAGILMLKFILDLISKGALSSIVDNTRK